MKAQKKKKSKIVNGVVLQNKKVDEIQHRKKIQF